MSWGGGELLTPGVSWRDTACRVRVPWRVHAACVIDACDDGARERASGLVKEE